MSSPPGKKVMGTDFIERGVGFPTFSCFFDPELRARDDAGLKEIRKQKTAEKFESENGKTGFFQSGRRSRHSFSPCEIL